MENLDFAEIYNRFRITGDDFDHLGLMGYRQISAGLGFLETHYGINPIDDTINWDALHEIDGGLFSSYSDTESEEPWDYRTAKVAAFISLTGKVCDAIFTLRVEQERSQRVALVVEDTVSLPVEEVTELEWDEGNAGSRQIEAAMKHVMAGKLAAGNQGELTWEDLVGYDKEAIRMKREDRGAYVAKVNALAALCGRSMDIALEKRRNAERSYRVAC